MTKDELWQWVDRASWSYHNLIGQTTTLPIVLGGTGTSTVAALASTLGLSSMAYQASSNIAITGGSVSALAFLSTTAISTGTLRALTNVSSATVSTADLTGATRVSSLSVSTLNLYATTAVSTVGISTSTFRALANVSSASVSTADLTGATRVSTLSVSTASLYATTSVSTAATSTGTLRATASVSSASVSTGALYASGVVSFTAVKTLSVADTPYTVAATDRYIRCNCSSGSITVLMPAASGPIREIYVKKIDSTVSTVTISSVATDTFDGRVTTALASQWATKGFINPITGIWERLNTPTI